MKINWLGLLMLFLAFNSKLLGGIYPTIQTAKDNGLKCFTPIFQYQDVKVDKEINKIISKKGLFKDTLQVFFMHETANQTYERCMIFLVNGDEKTLVSDFRYFYRNLFLFKNHLKFSKTKIKNILNDTSYLFSQCNNACNNFDTFKRNSHGGSGVYKTIVFKKNKVEDITNYKDFTW